MDAVTRHEQQVNRGISYHTIWKDCQREAIMGDLNMGTFISSDFVDPPRLTNGTADGGWFMFGDTAVGTATIAAKPTQKFGVLEFATTGNDNHQATLASGANLTGIAPISLTAGDIHALWAEWRWRPITVADAGIYTGLGEEGLAIDNGLMVDNTMEVADKDLLGFHTLAATPTRLDAVYRLAGGAKVIHSQGVNTLVANTWVKCGITYNRKVVRYWVNGVQVGAVLLPSAANFPLAQMLAWYHSIKTGQAVSALTELDWMELFVEY